MNRRDLFPAVGAGAALGILAGLTGSPLSACAAPVDVTPDPLLDLVNLYRATRDDVDARHITLNEHFDAEMDRLVDPLWRRLKHETPSATTEAGALAALRLAHEEMEHSRESFEGPLVAAALAYFEGRST